MMTPPNILWYCTDQQRFDTIAALGNPHVHTPTIDSLVAEGMAFTTCYCQSPICTPSRASFLTGLYPARARNCRNGNESYPNHPKLVSRRLADAGYDCGLIGKFHLQSAGHRPEPRLADDGYTFWKFSHAPRDDWPVGHDYAEWVRDQGGDLDELRQSDDRVPPEWHQTTWATERAIEFVTAERSRPWMLSVNVYDPHPPFIPPRAYADRFDPDNMPGPHFRSSDLAAQALLADVDFQTWAADPESFDGRRIQALYYAMIAQVDDQLARLLDCLDGTGQRDNTLVIFTSDHGESLGDHGLLYKGCRFYEGLVRVPLIFRWPGRVQAGRHSDALVELLDKSATILDVAGASGLDEIQGQSLWPVLCGDVDPGTHRAFVRSEYYDALDPAFVGTGSPDTPRDTASEDEVNEPESGTFGTMYRDRRHKLVVYHGHEIGELFDLEEDPWEFDNLWDDPGSAALKSRLLKASFDASMRAGIDVGTRRIAPM
mgnify:CR=1 FL=1